ncbi:MAG: tetratricopeptide repeat protein [Phycisphaerales bacterium]|nr:tetratricopeptide repeat protein [Phycisphaerales bacterium]
MANFPNDGTGNNERDLPNDLVVRQTRALERLAICSDPAYQPRKKLLAKLIGAFVAAAAAVVGGSEFVRYLWESHAQRVMILNWVGAAREIYEVEGNAEAATELLERAREIAPQNADVLKLAAYIDGMQTVEALINLDRPLQREEVSRYARAAGQAVMLERVDPASADWAILRGQLTLVANEPERARLFLERAIELDPENSFAVLRMALVHLKLSTDAKDEVVRDDELKLCSEMLDRALAMSPKSKWVHLWLGTIELEHHHDPASARGHFRDAINIDQRFVNAHHSLGMVAERLEELDAAEKSYVRALEIRPDLAVALIGLATVYGSRDMYEISLRYARRATTADPGSLESWRMRGVIATERAKELGVSGNSEGSKEAVAEAILSYSSGLDLDPRNGDSYIARADLYLQTGQIREAGDDARNAVLFAPSDPYAWNVLGKVHAKGSFHAEAVESFGEVIRLDPKFDDAYLGRARSNIVLGDPDAAFADFDLAVAYASDDLTADILVARGLALASVGRYDQALADCVNARTADKRSFDAWIAEAEVLGGMGRREDSRLAAREALMLRPNDERARTLEGSAQSSAPLVSPAPRPPSAEPATPEPRSR